MLPASLVGGREFVGGRGVEKGCAPIVRTPKVCVNGDEVARPIEKGTKAREVSTSTGAPEVEVGLRWRDEKRRLR